MNFIKKFPLGKLKMVCYIVNTVFVGVNILAILMCLLKSSQGMTRGKQIVATYMIIGIIPSIPYYFGIFFEISDLLFPNLVAYLFIVIMDLVVVVLCGMVYKDPLLKNMGLVVALIVSVLVCIVCGLLTVMLIAKLLLKISEDGDDKMKFGDYSIRRFDAIPVTTEGKHLKKISIDPKPEKPKKQKKQKNEPVDENPESKKDS